MPLAACHQVPAVSHDSQMESPARPRLSIRKMCRHVILGGLWLALALVLLLWIVVLVFADNWQQKASFSWLALIVVGILGGLLWAFRRHVQTLASDDRRGGAPRPPFSVGRLCRQVVIGILWIVLGLLLVVWILVLVCGHKWGEKANLSLDIWFVISVLGSLIHSLQRCQRWADAHAVAALEPSPMAHKPLPRPRRVRCRSLTRGTGELRLDQDGSLHFVPEENLRLREWIFGDIDPRTLSIFQLIFGMARLRRQAQGHRSLTLERSQIQTAVAFDRVVLGPSMVIGYTTPSRPGMQYEEFFFSNQAQAAECFAEATANPDEWVEALAPDSTPPAVREEAIRYRKQAHRHLALASCGLVGMIITALYMVMFLIICPIVLCSAGNSSAGLAAAILLSLWLGCNLLSSLIVLFSWR